MSEKTLRKVKRQLPLYLMALPGLIYLLINNYIPMSGLVVAFKNFNFKDGIYSSPWCGFQNFKYLFSTSTSFVITRNTLLYNLVFIVLNTVVALSLIHILSLLAFYRFCDIILAVHSDCPPLEEVVCKLHSTMWGKSLWIFS